MDVYFKPNKNNGQDRFFSFFGKPFFNLLKNLKNKEKYDIIINEKSIEN